MNISVSTKMDLDAIRSLYRVGTFKRRNPKKAIAIILSFIVLVIALTTFLGFYEYDTVYLTYAFFLFILLLLYCFILFAVPWINHKSMCGKEELVNNYVFEDDMMTVSSKTEGAFGESKRTYESLDRVMETGKYLFLYINRNQAYIVKKSDFARGDVDVLKAYLKTKLGKKYIICKY